MASLTTHPPPDGDHGHLQPHYEPQGRWGHCSTLIDGKVFMWGGICGAAGTPDDHSSFVDIYDPASQRWTQQKTSGDPPLGVIGAACVGVSPYMYIFAGLNLAGECYNSIHCLDTRNLVWTEISAVNSQEAPMKKRFACMVSYSDSQLVTIGGYGVLPENSRPNAEYVANTEEGCEGRGWTNEMGVFHLSSSKLIINLCSTLFVCWEPVASILLSVHSGKGCSLVTVIIVQWIILFLALPGL